MTPALNLRRKKVELTVSKKVRVGAKVYYKSALECQHAGISQASHIRMACCYWAVDRLPFGEPTIGDPAGSGRAATRSDKLCANSRIGPNTANESS